MIRDSPNTSVSSTFFLCGIECRKVLSTRKIISHSHTTRSLVRASTTEDRYETWNAQYLCRHWLWWCVRICVCVRWSWIYTQNPAKCHIFRNTQSLVYILWACNSVVLIARNKQSMYSCTNTDRNKNQVWATTKKGRRGISAPYKPHTNTKYSAITMLFTLNW